MSLVVGLIQSLVELRLWQRGLGHFPFLKRKVMMGFNYSTIRAFDIKLIFSDHVGLGRERRIYEIKAP